MPRYIDADELINRLRESVRELRDEDIDYRETATFVYTDAILRAKCLPTIYPDGDHTLHGRWNKIGINEYECTCCKSFRWNSVVLKFSWCPMCGAKMDEEVKNDDN